MNKFWCSFLYNVLEKHISLAFESGVLFKLLTYIIPNILKDFRPFIHERLSFLLARPVKLGSPYFSTLVLNAKLDDFLSTLQI